MTEGSSFTSTCTCFDFLILTVLKFHVISGVYMIRGFAVQSLEVHVYWRASLHTRNSSTPTVREYFSPRVHYILLLIPRVKLAEIRITAFMKSHSNIVKVFKPKSNFHFVIQIFTLLKVTGPLIPHFQSPENY
jgi:hypothetical protein